MRVKGPAITIPIILVVLSCGRLFAQDPILLKIPPDLPALEFVGQFVNDSNGSHQYGYISRIEGLSLDSIFSGTPQNQDTALFTFCSETRTVRVLSSGVLTIVNREGPTSTTTVYFTPNPSPRDSTDRSTFCSGMPIQTSSYRQQVVVDNSTLAFTTVHLNKITAVSPFTLNGTEYQLGQAGKSFRTNYSGHVNTSAPPSGWFGGYAVGIK